VSVLEIENAIRQLPREEAEALIARLKHSQAPNSTNKPLTDEAIDEWRVRSGFAAGLTTDEYLKIIRGG
jgi:hypothetical protein